VQRLAVLSFAVRKGRMKMKNVIVVTGFLAIVSAASGNEYNCHYQAINSRVGGPSGPL
jgi:hypothetical protein